MNRKISGFGDRRNRPHDRAVMTRFACAFGLVITACGDLRDGPREAAMRLDSRGVHEEGHSAVDEIWEGGASESTLTSFEDCLKRHVAERGSMRAVTELVCPGTAESVCDAPLDLTLLAGLENVTSLDLSQRCVSDVGPLASLRKLEHLGLRGNQVKDIRPLGALRALRSLDLANNPISDTWNIKTKRPFSQWSRLEELNLDGTGMRNIIPLEALTSLRVLHLRECAIVSLRALRPLTNLRELHIDRNEFSDLSPLEGLVELEELTANDNYISSFEPLRHLAQIGGLRKASLDKNCLSSCEELEAADVSCRESKGACEAMEDFASPMALSVPVDLVEQHAPSGDLPLWTHAQVERAFEIVSTRDEIGWDDPSGNCDGRARETQAILAAAGFPAMTNVLAYGNLRPLTPNFRSGFVSFSWHVAAAVRTAQGYVVFDPAFEPRPLALREWYARLVDSKGVDLNYSCLDYWGSNASSALLCGPNGAVTIDERGRLTVDEPGDVRGTVCRDSSCPPL